MFVIFMTCLYRYVIIYVFLMLLLIHFIFHFVQSTCHWRWVYYIVCGSNVLPTPYWIYKFSNWTKKIIIWKIKLYRKQLKLINVFQAFCNPLSVSQSLTVRNWFNNSSFLPITSFSTGSLYKVNVLENELVDKEVLV